MQIYGKLIKQCFDIKHERNILFAKKLLYWYFIGKCYRRKLKERNVRYILKCFNV